MRSISKRFLVVWVTLVLLPAALTMPSALLAQTKSSPGDSSKYTLTVLNPQGSVTKNRDLSPRLGSLEGKRIALWLSATPDQVYAGKGAELYDLLEKMLKEKYPGIHIIPYAKLPMKFAPENEVVAAIMATQPDGVVVAFGG